MNRSSEYQLSILKMYTFGVTFVVSIHTEELNKI